ncbi:MAG: hypothetical protein KF684_08420 [Phycisphaeraceae bacterium]|nr:hypothetical protein [Phycisphaeraceae bacterium]
MHDEESIGPPFHIVIGVTRCYRCGGAFEVAAIAGSDPEGHACFSTHIESMPEALLDAVRAQIAVYRKVFSRSVGHQYYANICPHCDALSGDFFLHQPGELFGVMEPEDAHGLRVISVGPNVNGSIVGSALFGSSLDLIFEAATKA